LGRGHHPPFPPDAPALIAQVYDGHIAAEVKLALMNLYPDEHPVKLVHAAGTENMLVEELALYEVDRSAHTGLLTSLYLPPLKKGSSYESLQEISAHLRAPDGCPWDREQTLGSMRPHLLEEAYEALVAIDSDDRDQIREELGDLLLVVTMLMQIASEEKGFNSADVITTISDKLIYRHPHVFGDLQVEGVDGVLVNWEHLKAEEREAGGEAGKGLLEGISIALPALSQAQEYQSRVARVGFDWAEIAQVFAKVYEEIDEIRAAPEGESRSAEVGDLLFSVVNLARWYGVDAESALREANARFSQRFSAVEQAAHQQGRELTGMSLKEMDALWEEAKGRDHEDV
jgi:tetrapyrrole methylase family protein/MazG family protein